MSCLFLSGFHSSRNQLKAFPYAASLTFEQGHRPQGLTGIWLFYFSGHEIKGRQKGNNVNKKSDKYIYLYGDFLGGKSVLNCANIVNGSF